MKRRTCLVGTIAIVLALGFVVFACIYAANAAQFSQTQRNKDMAHAIAEQLRAEGHPEDHPVIVACQEWWRSEDEAERGAETYPQIEIVEFTTHQQRTEYPVAAAVWQNLRASGMSEVSAAAILGSMMAECGGQTLDLMPYTYAGGYYGLCMWSLYYFPEVDGLSVPDQVQFLLDTLDSNMAVAGGSAEEFFAITDVRQAARYFSDKYERPASWAIQRANNALAAYQYFSQEG